MFSFFGLLQEACLRIRLSVIPSCNSLVGWGTLILVPGVCDSMRSGRSRKSRMLIKKARASWDVYHLNDIVQVVTIEEDKLLSSCYDDDSAFVLYPAIILDSVISLHPAAFHDRRTDIRSSLTTTIQHSLIRTYWMPFLRSDVSITVQDVVY